MNRKLLFLILISSTFVPTAKAQTTNAWSNANIGTFKWETGSNWSLGVPPSAAQKYIVMDKPIKSSDGHASRTVTIDATTVLSNAINYCLDIQSLSLVAVPSDLRSELFLNNTGSIALHIVYGGQGDVDTFVISTNGVVSVNNSTLTVDDPAEDVLSALLLADNPALSGGGLEGGEIDVEGTLLLNSGTINAKIDISGSGQMTMLDGTLSSDFLGVGTGIISTDTGTLTIGGGTVLAQSVEVGHSGGLGTIWLTGGNLTVFQKTEIGGDDSSTQMGTGVMTVSNGTWQSAIGVLIGIYGQGTLTLAGGDTDLEMPMPYPTAPVLQIGGSAGSAGTVWLTGGQLTVGLSTPGISSVIVGYGGVGQMTVSNGTWLTSSVLIGGGIDTNDIPTSSGGVGTLTVAGGTSSIYSNLVVGSGDCTGRGAVIVNGGALFVTNATHNAVLDVESGMVILSGGTLVADSFVITRPCGSFQQTGGTLVVGGVTNIVTVLPFSITSITSDGHNISIAWQTPGGVTNIVQATNGNPDGSYNTNFVDLSPPFILAGSSSITTNYLDIGGATNMPSRYYRVRLVP